ncbi:MAG: response regulator [Anaerolineaceae bacterium]|nr:MAG: response regulator [Anaerolineaceae bacterium]
MNLLIVDDEYYSVEGIYASIDWKSLSIKNVYKAYCMQDAQEIFKKHKIDILLSDIEMPKGSGLELLKWIRDKGYTTVTIFLTAYASFDYASSAIKLQSTDYILKPVDNEKLRECLINAINRVKQMDIQETYKASAKHWDSNKKKLEEQFWFELSTQIIPANTVQISRELKQFHLSTDLLDHTFYTSLLVAYTKPGENQWESNLFEYALRNIITEFFYNHKIDLIFTRLNEQQFLLCINKKYINNRSEFIRLSYEVLDSLCILPGVFQMFLGYESTLLKMGYSFQELMKTARNTLNDDCRVIDTTSPPIKKCKIELPNMDEWPDLLVKHQKSEVRDQALKYLSELKETNTADRSDLLQFYHSFMQIIYFILEKKEESAHRLFSGSTSEEIFEQACDSIENMKTWLTHAIDVIDECLLTISQSDSSVETIKKYIRNHINEELTRKTLASKVYLSPDYLSHVFREKTGQSLSSFILSERIKKAKDLLLFSKMSIRDIAINTGFSNISYFSRQFKNQTGKTPQEFRKK